MVAAIALVSLSLAQNPFPADLTVPKDWRYYYGKKSKYGRGAIYSPSGFEIAFPDYTPTGQVAYVHYEMNAGTFFFSTVIERTLVHVAVAPDGLVAVSFPNDPASGYKANKWPFDYWSQPKSTREVAQAILIPLTRLDHHKPEPGDKSALKHKMLPSPQSPFSLLQTVGKGGFLQRTPTELRLDSVVVSLTTSGPVKTKWSESTPLLGGTLEIAGGPDGKIWMTFSPPNRKPVTLSTADQSAPALVLGALAALSYSTGE
ncbi:MAG TPA: hypothetical protein PKA27_06190 [Fimbriimonadaceae bacterium]|nr:hypothetical protein [Fimbriimonadaceae bacterium]